MHTTRMYTLKLLKRQEWGRATAMPPLRRRTSALSTLKPRNPANCGSSSRSSR